MLVIERKKNQHGRVDLGWFTFNHTAMLVVIAIVAYAAFASQQAVTTAKINTKQQLISVCHATQETRDVLRQTVDAIHTLSSSSTERPVGSPPFTDSEIVQFNLFIDRVNEFRSEMYDKIKPRTECVPYVHDDHIVPPTPDTPHLKRKP